MENINSNLHFKKLHNQAILPTRGSQYAAGLDLYSVGDVTIPARGQAPVAIGLSVAVPVGYYARVAPRSGLAFKQGINIMAGVVDSDYRGELICLLANHTDTDYQVKSGDRVAQLIIEQILLPNPIFVDDLPATVRGEGGFGSTGHN